MNAPEPPDTVVTRVRFCPTSTVAGVTESWALGAPATTKLATASARLPTASLAFTVTGNVPVAVGVHVRVRASAETHPAGSPVYASE